MERVGTFYGDLGYITVIWLILGPFGNLTESWYIFPHFGILYHEKSGNPACTLAPVFFEREHVPFKDECFCSSAWHI
jgi:hypothetical protein